LERKEATDILREIISLGLAIPSLVSLEVNKQGKFSLEFNGDFNSQAIKDFVESRKLAFKENILKGFCIIYKP
jgi:hypothetical protein